LSRCSTWYTFLPYCSHTLLTKLEFTEHQRNVFCVFSGKGVNDLRTYLNQQNYAMGDEYDPRAVDDVDDDQTMTGMMGTTTLNGDEDGDVDADGDEDLENEDATQT
jgi:F-box and leucine-rich repeat protein GRR1